MRYHYFKKSSTRALILLGGTSPVRATSSDGQMVERAELQLVAEVDGAESVTIHHGEVYPTATLVAPGTMREWLAAGLGRRG